MPNPGASPVTSDVASAEVLVSTQLETATTQCGPIRLKEAPAKNTLKLIKISDVWKTFSIVKLMTSIKYAI